MKQHIKLCLLAALAMQSSVLAQETSATSQTTPVATATKETGIKTTELDSELVEELRQDDDQLEQDQIVAGEIKAEDIPQADFQPVEEEVVEFDEDGNEVVKKRPEAPKESKATAASLSNVKAVEGTKPTPVETKINNSPVSTSISFVF